ncbi:MAG: rRNA maturation RNase YbeY [Bacteroidetes bacterium]|nr:rRNA maturation RNase YbeY [Fibrella sp.]
MIRFFNEDTAYKLLRKTVVKQWLTRQAKLEGVAVRELNYIFCSDEYLLQINREHLNHDYYTDIITFDTSDDAGVIEGDVFISVDRVDDNWRIQQTSFADEMHRVLAHGLLHLCGYGDKTDGEVALMRQKEDEWLTTLPA